MNSIIQRQTCESGATQIWLSTDDTEFESWCEQFAGGITVLEQQASRNFAETPLHWYSVIVVDDFILEIFLLRWT
jgi:hypothetical protein